MHRGNDLYFDDPLLKLGIGTRLWVKSTRSIFNIVSFVAGMMMILSDVPKVVYLGIFLLALSFYSSFVVRILGVGRKFTGGNLLFFVDLEVREVIHRASDRSALMGGSFLLHLIRELMETEGGEAVIKRLGIEKEEFVAQVGRYLNEEKRLRETRSWRLRRAEELVIRALTTQTGRKHRIRAEDLMRAMVYMDNERAQRLFGIFGITESVMENSYKYKVHHVR